MARAEEEIHIRNPLTRDKRLNNKHLKGDDLSDVKEEIKASIQKQLFQWLTQQPADRYSTLPENSRKLSCLKYGFYHAHKRLALRNQIRPGDHFNVLLVSPSMFPCYSVSLRNLIIFYSSECPPRHPH